MEMIGDDERPILYFGGKEKGLALNKTNANTIANVFGDDTEDWRGGEIVLFETTVRDSVSGFGALARAQDIGNRRRNSVLSMPGAGDDVRPQRTCESPWRRGFGLASSCARPWSQPQGPQHERAPVAICAGRFLGFFSFGRSLAALPRPGARAAWAERLDRPAPGLTNLQGTDWAWRGR
jgi:hypothetical protein